MRVAADNADVAEAATVLLLCVKPNEIASVLAPLQPMLRGKLLISIAAGVTLARLQEAAGPEAKVIRVMPNTPSLVHKGAAAFADGENTTAEELHIAEKILLSIGTAFHVPEKLLDAVTGLSGSGPAFVYLMIEAMADGGVRMGLPRELALQLAAQTVSGAGEMVLQTGLHPAQLKDMVTSPGGTTIAGIAALESHGVRSGFLAAVEAATRRSKELGEQ